MATTRVQKKNAVMARTMAIGRRGNVAPVAMSANRETLLRARVRLSPTAYSALVQAAVQHYAS